MCSFIFGCALSEPVLGPYFQLPKKMVSNYNLIHDMNQQNITDVSMILIQHLKLLFY